ncbi:MAG TPA: CoA transferase [Methylomirabilota bacterium]|nr:CoA transferase [Methylomirabilota bacterium]
MTDPTALAGLRVLDCSRFIAGPYCGMLLGDLGADVVKVERPQGGDEARGFGPAIAGETLYLMVYNRNKRSLTLDFRHAGGPALLRELVVRADVLIENFRPGVMEAMDCGWPALRALNPRLVMARVSGFGQDGPLAERPGLDVVGQAMGGLMHLTGAPDGPPTMAGVYVVDCVTGLHATIGILAALARRQVTGRGQLVDASLLDGAVSLLSTAIPEQLALGGAVGRQGNRDRYAAPSNTFRAGDGAWVHIVAGSQALFVRLAEVMGRPDLLADPDFATQEARVRNAAAIEHITAEWAVGHAADALVEQLNRAGVPAAQVATIADVVVNPQLRHRARIAQVEHPSAGAVPVVGPVIGLSESPAAIRRPAPRLGEHTDEVLREWLDLAPARITALRAAGVL